MSSQKGGLKDVHSGVVEQSSGDSSYIKHINGKTYTLVTSEELIPTNLLKSEKKRRESLIVLCNVDQRDEAAAQSMYFLMTEEPVELDHEIKKKGASKIRSNLEPLVKRLEKAYEALFNITEEKGQLERFTRDYIVLIYFARFVIECSKSQSGMDQKLIGAITNLYNRIVVRFRDMVDLAKSERPEAFKTNTTLSQCFSDLKWLYKRVSDSNLKKFLKENGDGSTTYSVLKSFRNHLTSLRPVINSKDLSNGYENVTKYVEDNIRDYQRIILNLAFVFYTDDVKIYHNKHDPVWSVGVMLYLFQNFLDCEKSEDHAGLSPRHGKSSNVTSGANKLIDSDDEITLERTSDDFIDDSRHSDVDCNSSASATREPILQGHDFKATTEGKIEFDESDRIKADIPQIDIPPIKFWTISKVNENARNPPAFPFISLERLSAEGIRTLKCRNPLRKHANEARKQMTFDDLIVPLEYALTDSELAMEFSMEDLEKLVEHYNKLLASHIDDIAGKKGEGSFERLAHICSVHDELISASMHCALMKRRGVESDDMKSIRSQIEVFNKQIKLCIPYVREVHWEAPRAACRRLVNLVGLIREHLKSVIRRKYDKENSPIFPLIKQWNGYFKAVYDILCGIDKCNDNVIILANLNFFKEARSGFAAFSLAAEKVDTFAGENILTISQRALLHAVNSITNFVDEKKFQEYVLTLRAVEIAEDLKKRLSYFRPQVLKSRFVHYAKYRSTVLSLSGLFDVIISDMSSRHVEYRETDVYQLIIKHYTDEIEPYIAAETDPQKFAMMHSFYVALTEFRLNLLKVAVQTINDREDSFFNGYIKQNIDQFACLTKMFNEKLVAHKQSRERCDVYVRNLELWCSVLEDIGRSFEDIASVSPVFLSNFFRYEMVCLYFGDLYKFFVDKRFTSLFEDQKPFINANRENLLAIRSTMNYCYDTAFRLRNECPVKLPADDSKFPRRRGTDIFSLDSIFQLDLSYFSHRFIKKASEEKYRHQLEAFMQNVSTLSNQPLQQEIAVTMHKYISAQVNSLTRNYNINNQSTRLLFDLISTYCNSVRAVSDELANAIQNNTVVDLKKVVDYWTVQLDKISPSARDVPVFTSYGLRRLRDFAQICFILGHLTGINVKHLVMDSERIDDSPLNSDIRELQLVSLPLNRRVEEMLKTSAATTGETVAENMIPVLAKEHEVVTFILDIAREANDEIEISMFHLEGEHRDKVLKLINKLREPHVNKVKKSPSSSRDSADAVCESHSEFYDYFSVDNKYDGATIVSLSTKVSNAIRSFADIVLDVHKGRFTVDIDNYYDYVYKFERSFASTLEQLVETGARKGESFAEFKSEQNILIGKIMTRLSCIEKLVSDKYNYGELKTVAKSLYSSFGNIRNDVILDSPRSELVRELTSMFKCLGSVMLCIYKSATEKGFKGAKEVDSRLRLLIWKSLDCLDSALDVTRRINECISKDCLEVASLESWIRSSASTISSTLPGFITSIPPSLPYATLIKKEASVINSMLSVYTVPYYEL